MHTHTHTHTHKTCSHVHAQAARGEFGDDEKKGQKEITLKEDVPADARALLYRDYLMSSMQGRRVGVCV
jgi:hypothetical protein